MFNLPPIQNTESAWIGPELAGRKSQWVFRLDTTELRELETAAEKFLSSGQSLGQLTKKDFVLPTFATKLEKFRTQLIHGIGFFLLKGLPVERFSEMKTAIIFYGLGAHLGRARSQNAQGHILGHVRNLGLESTDPRVRIYQTGERQTFHTDSSDAVGLLCLQEAKSGGLSLLVSADTVFNEIHNRRPDLLQLLLQPIATDRRGEVPAGMPPFLLIPVFTYFSHRVSVFYQRQYIESAQRFEDAPRLSPKHFEALNLFDELCNSVQFNLSMMLEKGDMQFVYNHSMLHDRTAFEDWPQMDKRRHLLRLWISLPGDRPLAPVFSSRYGSVEIGNRGGIVVPGTKFCFPTMDEVLSSIR